MQKVKLWRTFGVLEKNFPYFWKCYSVRKTLIHVPNLFYESKGTWISTNFINLYTHSMYITLFSCKILYFLLAVVFDTVHLFTKSCQLWPGVFRRNHSSESMLMMLNTTMEIWETFWKHEYQSGLSFMEVSSYNIPRIVFKAIGWLSDCFLEVLSSIKRRFISFCTLSSGGLASWCTNKRRECFFSVSAGLSGQAVTMSVLWLWSTSMIRLLFLIRPSTATTSTDRKNCSR